MASVIKAGNATDGVQVTSDNTGILELKTGTGSGTTAMTVGTGQNVTFAQAANLPNTFGFKNRIINGAMSVHQRGGTISASGTVNTYGLDRFAMRTTSGSAVVSMQQSTTAPAGFYNSLLCTVTTPDSSLAADDLTALHQKIEGVNVADLGWGTANAQSVTVSFQVRSSITGTYGVGIQNNDGNRSYPSTITINAADTWETKTVTIPGDTSGTWNLGTTSTALYLFFSLGAGSNYTGGTTNAWNAADRRGASGQVNWTGTNGATFYITGVQLEKGSTATSFDVRPYSTELQLCQRYFIQYGDNTTLKPISFGSASSTVSVDTLLSLPVEMRSVPTISASANLQASDWNNALTLTSPTLGGSTSKTLYLYGTVTGATQYRPYFIRTSASNGYIHFSAEL